MYDYLRGTLVRVRDGTLVLDVANVGYAVVVPPLVEQAVSDRHVPGEDLLVFVAAQASSDHPWPTLFGFLDERQRDFWELLASVPRFGGRSAAKCMSEPVGHIAQAIVNGDRAWLDALPGITLDGADKLITTLRKKATAFLEQDAVLTQAAQPGLRTPADERRDDAVSLLVAMGMKRPDASRRVDALLASYPEVASVQDIVTLHFRAPLGV